MKLVIVESPSKISKLRKILGPGYDFGASVGHVRDLPKREMGVDFDTYRPQYVWSEDKGPGGRTRSKKTVVDDLKAKAKRCDEVILATDPDREGEAIAWHLADVLGLPVKTVKRIEFHSITPAAVKAAVASPRTIDMKRVGAQEARRVLDRLCGYRVSNALPRGLSAGRVQTPALRLVVERDELRSKHTSVDHFTVVAQHDGFASTLDVSPWKTPDQKVLTDRAVAQAVQAKIEGSSLEISSDEEKRRPSAPQPAFTTTSMLKAASAQLGMKIDLATRLAQKLYEAGLITYIRTDSPVLSDEAVESFQGWVTANQPTLLGSSVSQGKVAEGAQEAHEGIRPTDPSVTPESPSIAALDDQMAKLYTMVWVRGLGAVCKPAIDLHRVVLLDAGKHDGKPLTFRSVSTKELEPGWRALSRLYRQSEAADIVDAATDEDDDSQGIPQPLNGPVLVASATLKTGQTQPPKAFTIPTLIDRLEKAGVGRPSTYRAIMANLLARKYLDERGKTVVSTDVGQALIGLLRNRHKFADVDFTRDIEKQLDAIADGGVDVRAFLREYDAGLTAELTAWEGTDAGAGLDKFAKANSPTDKMIRAAKGRAAREQIPLPNDALTDFEACSKFLSEMGDGPFPPSPNQLKFAESIRDDIGEQIPDDALKDSKALGAWIDTNKSKMKPQKASPKQIEFVGKICAENGVSEPEGYPDNLLKADAGAFLDKHMKKRGGGKAGSGAKRKSPTKRKTTKA